MKLRSFLGHVVVGAILATALIAVGHAGGAFATEPVRILWVGDSYAQDTESEFEALLPAGYTLAGRTLYGGTAPCDLADMVVANAKTLDVDMLVVTFVGNNRTACMGGRTGVALRGSFVANVTWMCEALDVRCLIVGGPAMESVAGPWPVSPGTLLDDYRRAGFETVDAGAAVEDRNGKYRPELRDADGVHLNQAGEWLFANEIVGVL